MKHRGAALEKPFLAPGGIYYHLFRKTQHPFKALHPCLSHKVCQRHPCSSSCILPVFGEINSSSLTLLYFYWWPPRRLQGFCCSDWKHLFGKSRLQTRWPAAIRLVRLLAGTSQRNVYKFKQKGRSPLRSKWIVLLKAFHHIPCSTNTIIILADHVHWSSSKPSWLAVMTAFYCFIVLFHCIWVLNLLVLTYQLVSTVNRVRL